MGGCLGGESSVAVPNITIDLAAQPSSDSERKTHSSVTKLLEKGPENLKLLSEYKGCEKYIRTALADPTPETEKAAWNAVEKAVDQLYKFYKFALGIEQVLPELLTALCGTADSATAIQSNQALVKQFAEIFDFAFHFDEMKMVNPAIQNDFSYYRRVLSRMRTAAQKGGNKEEDDKKKKKKKQTKVNEEVANKMSFFFAYPTPMMKVVIDTTTQMPNSTQLVNGLALIANITCTTLENAASAAEMPLEAKMLLLCAMTGTVILVDHLEGQGAFHKKSPIRIRNCITLLKNFNEKPTDFLLNSLRFTTLHLNDESTMPTIQKLLA